MKSPAGYSRMQIALRWIVVALVAAQYIFKDAIAHAWMAWQQELPCSIRAFSRTSSWTSSSWR